MESSDTFFSWLLYFKWRCKRWGKNEWNSWDQILKNILAIYCVQLIWNFYLLWIILLCQKKNEWKFEIFFTLIFIHTLTTEQDFEFLLQSGVSIVCSGSSIGLFQAYYIPSRQSQVHLRSTHSFICHPPAVYLGYSDRIKFFIHLSENFLDFLKELPLTTLYNKNSKSCSSPISM